MEEKAETAGGHEEGCFFCHTVKPFFERTWSDATRNHFRNSRVEFLKGVRSLLDARIARLVREENKGTHVVVE
jgi:hypothetical protein